MKRLSIALLILISLVLQGFVASACHHADQKQVATESCHQEAIGHKNMSEHQGHSAKSESLAQMSPSHQDPACLMCSTGRCFSEAPITFQFVADASAEKPVVFKVFNPASVWGAVHFRQQLLGRFKPPLVSFLLPQLRNWQAFFSLFLN